MKGGERNELARGDVDVSASNFSQRCEKRSRIRVWQIDRRFISFAAVLISFFAIIHIAASASEMTTVMYYLLC